MFTERRIEKRWFPENIPQELKDLPIWIGFRFIPQEDKKPKKMPLHAVTGSEARSNDPGTWSMFDALLAGDKVRHFDANGIGLQAPYVGIDLDHSVIEGVIQSWAREIIEAFDSYTEFSPTGTGVHILCKGELAQGRKFVTLDIEIYQTVRFFTVTGDLVPGCNRVIEDRAEQVTRFFEVWEKKNEANKFRRSVIKKAEKSKDGADFTKLRAGNWQADYPSQSEADLAFCGKLAFWTGKDAALMDALFRESGLMRPKWDEKHFADGRTYGQEVINKAISGCQEVYAGTNVPGIGRRGKLTQGEIITQDCEENVEDFFHDQHGNPFVVIPVEEHVEVCATGSQIFRNWMSTRFRAQFGMPPKSDAVNQAMIQVEARCAASRQVELFNRVGWFEDKIYYDLTTPDHQGVEISTAGWRLIPLPPVFRRSRHQARQVAPAQGGDARDILRFCNVDPADHCLFMVAVASFFIPDIPHVIISQNGEQGSGKSNNSRRIKSLGDPSTVMLISSPKDLEHAQMIAEKHWISTFDNISKIHEWFSDFLCRGVTGEGDMKRSLYTNDDEFIRSYRRCFVLNGIGASMWRADLLDRAVIFDIPILKSTRSEKHMEADWRVSLPGILGGFFTALSRAMTTMSEVSGHERFRMSDFAQWGAALADALGYSSEEFFRKYQESVDRKWQDTAEDSSLAKKLTYFIDRQGGFWQGSAADLLKEITTPDREESGIPRTAKWLSTELLRIAPVMRNVGIDIIKKDKREGGTGRRLFTICRTGSAVREEAVSKGGTCEQDDDFFSERPY